MLRRPAGLITVAHIAPGRGGGPGTARSSPSMRTSAPCHSAPSDRGSEVARHLRRNHSAEAALPRSVITSAYLPRDAPSKALAHGVKPGSTIGCPTGSVRRRTTHCGVHPSHEKTHSSAGAHEPSHSIWQGPVVCASPTAPPTQKAADEASHTSARIVAPTSVGSMKRPCEWWAEDGVELWGVRRWLVWVGAG